MTKTENPVSAVTPWQRPRRTTIAVVCALLWSTGGANAANLKSVYESALDNDPTLAGQRYTYQADQQSIVQARSALRPQIDLRAGYARNDQHVSTSAGNSDGNWGTASLGVTARQNIYDRSRRTAVSQAYEQVKLSSVQLDDARQALALDVAQRYFAALRAIDNLEVSERELAAIGRQLDLARERLDVGLGTRTDLTEAQSRFKLAQVSKIESTNAIDDALRAIEELTGASPAELASLRDDAPLSPPTPNNLELWLSMARENSLQIRAAQQQARVAHREIQRQRDARYPTLDLTYSDTLNDSSGSTSGLGSESISRSLALQLSMPLYQGGLVNSRIEEADLRYRATLKRVDALVRATERDIRNAFLDVTSSIDRVDALRQAVEASQATVDAKKEGFDAGVNTNIDVLDAQRDLFRAQRDYLSARYEYILRQLQLARLGGRLNGDDIDRINRWLQ